MKETVLVIDDEEGIRQVLGAALETDGYEAILEETGDSAEKRVRDGSVDCVILDLVLPDKDGLEILETILTEDPELPVIMVTGHASVETAVEAMRRGAFDYFVKPLSLVAVSVVVSKALESRRLRQECRRLRRQIEERFSAKTLVGTSTAMRNVFQLIDRVAFSPSPVLICGEAGLGKARVARAIHEAGRKGEPFVTVDCTSMESEALGKALFGHPHDSQSKGAFQQASSGSLFLRDVGSMPQPVQARLAETLEGRNDRQHGGGERRPCRILASSRTDLDQLRRQGRFREDLYYRLNVVRIDIPPVRERPEDIPALLSHFLRQSSEDFGVPPKVLTPDARAQIMDYPWPGNVRQLENAVERAVALAYGRDTVSPEDLPAEVRSGKPVLLPWLVGKAPGGSLPEILTALEQQLVLNALDRANWVKTRAADLLKVKRTTLIEKMKRLGIPLRNGNLRKWAS